jgi:putative SOS response-associated peptidase YedK
MCGRYSLAPKKKQVDLSLEDTPLPAEVQEHYNIAPTHDAVVLTDAGWKTMQWGLVPHWSADGANQGKLINARCETVFEKPSFRDAVRRRRCVVPADSFYEWRREPGGRKIPYRILSASGKLLYMAGIWETWHGEKNTFSILTTSANSDVCALHDRMPVFLCDEPSRKKWLDPETSENELLEMMQPAPAGYLTMYRVSERINAPGPDDAGLHEPVQENPTLF